jgi:RNA polymerase sigma-70 factor (ECF subfamily)
MAPALSRAALTTAFEEHRAALRFHCYQMLGTLSDAEDLVQDTFGRALDASEDFEGRATIKTWLFRIATFACIDELRRRKRRRLVSLTKPNGAETEDPESLDPDGWIQPFPDGLLPDQRYARVEAVTLAFVAALQWLPARQRAILVLRDSLDWSAQQVGELLGMTTGSVHAALKRARATMATRPLGRTARNEDLATARTFAAAYERGDVDQLVTMLRRDVEVHMPPFKLWLRGPDHVIDFVQRRIWPGRKLELTMTRANGRPAVTMIDRAANDAPFAVVVFERIAARRVVTLHAFLMPGIVKWFAPAPKR